MHWHSRQVDFPVQDLFPDPNVPCSNVRLVLHEVGFDTTTMSLQVKGPAVEVPLVGAGVAHPVPFVAGIHAMLALRIGHCLPSAPSALVVPVRDKPGVPFLRCDFNHVAADAIADNLTPELPFRVSWHKG